MPSAMQCVMCGVMYCYVSCTVSSWYVVVSTGMCWTVLDADVVFVSLSVCLSIYLPHYINLISVIRFNLIWSDLSNMKEMERDTERERERNKDRDRDRETHKQREKGWRNYRHMYCPSGKWSCSEPASQDPLSMTLTEVSRLQFVLARCDFLRW